MKLVQYYQNSVNTVDTEGLVHQGISSHTAEYAQFHFQLFMG